MEVEEKLKLGVVLLDVPFEGEAEKPKPGAVLLVEVEFGARPNAKTAEPEEVVTAVLLLTVDVWPKLNFPVSSKEVATVDFGVREKPKPVEVVGGFVDGSWRLEVVLAREKLNPPAAGDEMFSEFDLTVVPAPKQNLKLGAPLVADPFAVFSAAVEAVAFPKEGK